MNRGWIDARKELPKTDMDVLICIDKKMQIGKYKLFWMAKSTSGYNLIENVLAWWDGELPGLPNFGGD